MPIHPWHASPHISFFSHHGVDIVFDKEAGRLPRDKSKERRIIMKRKNIRGKRWTGIVTAACLALILGAAVTATASDNSTSASGNMPETLDLNLQKLCPSIPGLPADKKDVKGFSHSKHANEYLKGKEKFSKHPYTDEFTCTACHTGAKSPESITEAGVCDSVKAELEKAGGPKKMSSLFHKTCKSCHSAMKKAGEKTGPTSCKGCHK